jgi:dipeptidyl aminopeptidase/acylaminoacyl peptidase
VLNLISSLPTVDKADPGRVGLWGHSMGGGVALKAAVVSKAVDAVAVFGSVSADERVNYQNGMGNGPGAYGVNRLGAPDSNQLVYKRISPINYLDRSPPLSIHHGQADAIVPYQWSEDLFEAAQEQGATAELYLYPGAGHTFVDQDWQLAMERTLAFFDQHVKAGGR